MVVRSRVERDAARLRREREATASEPWVRDVVGVAAAASVSADAFEVFSRNLSSAGALLGYSGGDLATITYTSGVVKTFNYSGGDLVSVVLSGAIPTGMVTTKTFSYSGGELVSVSYS